MKYSYVLQIIVLCSEYKHTFTFADNVANAGVDDCLTNFVNLIWQ